MWFRRHKTKVIQRLAVTETDWSPFFRRCDVCVFVYIIVIGLIQKLTEVLIDILNTNIKSFRVTKYKLFIFMATTRLLIIFLHRYENVVLSLSERTTCAPT